MRHRFKHDGPRAEPADPLRAMAGPGLLTHALVARLDDHAPLHRQAGSSPAWAPTSPTPRSSAGGGRAGDAGAAAGDREDRGPCHGPCHGLRSAPRPVTPPSACSTARAAAPGWAAGSSRAASGPACATGDRGAGPAPPGVVHRLSPDREGERPRRHLASSAGMPRRPTPTAACRELHVPSADERSRFREAACRAHPRRAFHDVWTATQSAIARDALDRTGALRRASSARSPGGPRTSAAPRGPHTARPKSRPSRHGPRSSSPASPARASSPAPSATPSSDGRPSRSGAYAAPSGATVPLTPEGRPRRHRRQRAIVRHRFRNDGERRARHAPHRHRARATGSSRAPTPAARPSPAPRPSSRAPSRAASTTGPPRRPARARPRPPGPPPRRAPPWNWTPAITGDQAAWTAVPIGRSQSGGYGPSRQWSTAGARGQHRAPARDLLDGPPVAASASEASAGTGASFSGARWSGAGAGRPRA